MRKKHLFMVDLLLLAEVSFHDVRVIRAFLSNKLSMMSTLSPNFYDDKETVSPESRPDIRSNHSLVSNAILKLRSLAVKESTLDGTTVDRPEEVRFEFSPLYSVKTDTLCK